MESSFKIHHKLFYKASIDFLKSLNTGLMVSVILLRNVITLAYNFINSRSFCKPSPTHNSRSKLNFIMKTSKWVYFLSIPQISFFWSRLNEPPSILKNWELPILSKWYRNQDGISKSLWLSLTAFENRASRQIWRNWETVNFLCASSITFWANKAIVLTQEILHHQFQW